MIGENLSTVERDYELICDSLQMPLNESAKNVHVLFKGMALDYYLSNLKDSQEGKGVKEVFDKMRDRFFAEDRKQRATMRWNTIIFQEFVKGVSKKLRFG